jgi:hypothetical protein
MELRNGDTLKISQTLLGERVVRDKRATRRKPQLWFKSGVIIVHRTEYEPGMRQFPIAADAPLTLTSVEYVDDPDNPIPRVIWPRMEPTSKTSLLRGGDTFTIRL